jgi:hypothetical protein
MNSGTTSPDPIRRQRWLTWCGWLLVAAALAAGLTTRWQYTHDSALDDDEPQHMHFAWCITQGIVPYRDFWDNHTPALHHALARIIDKDAAPSVSFVAARRWMFLIGLMTIAATFGLAWTLLGHRTAVLAAAWLACCEAFLDKTVEIRPDGMLATAIVMALWMLALALRSARSRERLALCFAAGLFFGLGLTFSPKVLIPLAMTLLAWAVIAWLDRRATPLRRTVAGMGSMAAGFALPGAAWLLYEASQGALDSALRYTLFETFSDLDRFSAWLALQTGWPFGLFAVALCGAARVFAGLRRREAAQRRVQLITIAGLGIAIVYTFVMPSPYLQSTAMFIPVLAILAGHATSGLVDWALSGRGSFFRMQFAVMGLLACVLLAAVHPILRIQQRRPQQRASLDQMLSRIDWIHSWTSENDVVFDGKCAATFRRHALSRPSLVRGVLSAYWEETLEPPIRDELRASGCTLIIQDARSSQIPPEDRVFVESHFVQAKEVDESLYLPGQSYEAAELEGDGAQFEVIVPGVYRVRRGSPESATLVDGLPFSRPAQLGLGLRRLQSSGPPSTLTIWRVPGQ